MDFCIDRSSLVLRSWAIMEMAARPTRMFLFSMNLNRMRVVIELKLGVFFLTKEENQIKERTYLISFLVLFRGTIGK
jgi:hypothetical protein